MLQCIPISGTRLTVEFLLQVVDTETGKTRVLDAGENMLLHKMFFPSPDEKYVAVVCPVAGPCSYLYIVDENGKEIFRWPRFKILDHERRERIAKAQSRLANLRK